MWCRGHTGPSPKMLRPCLCRDWPSTSAQVADTNALWKNCAWANWDFSSGCWRMFISNFWKQLVNSIGCCNAAWCSHTPQLSHGIVPLSDWSHVYRCLLHLFAFPPRQIRSHHKPKGLHWRTAPQFLTHVTLAEVMQVLRNEWMRAFVVCSCFGSRWGHPKAQRKSCSKVCLLW